MKRKQNHNTLFKDQMLDEELEQFTENAVTNFDAKNKIVNGWIAEIRSSKIVRMKEEEIKPRFLAEIFGKILGYNLNDPKEWNLRAELKTITDASKADAGLGEFEIFDREQRGRVVAVVEIKGYGADLDKPDRSGRSAVDQGFHYSRKTGARWVIVSNFRQTRLYESRYDGRYELFDFESLSEKKELLRFIFLLGRTGLIHKNRSRTERLLEANEFYTKRKPLNGEGHIIDQLHKAISQLEGFGFVDPKVICNIRPFTLIKQHVWHYHHNKIFTINGEIYKLLANTVIQEGVIKFSRTYERQLKKAKVKDANKKLHYVFSRLNDCLVLAIDAIRNYQEIETKRTGPNMYGFSPRHSFHFRQPEEGISKDIRLVASQQCNCVVCRFRSLDLKSFLQWVKESSKEEPTLETTYGQYLACSDNFMDVYRSYRKIIDSADGVPSRVVERYIAYCNLVSLHNLLQSDDATARERARDHIIDTDLEEILWNDLNIPNSKKLIRDLLRDMRDSKLLNEVQKQVDEVDEDFAKIISHYDKGGHYEAVGNYTFKYEHMLGQLYLFHNANFITADEFESYQTLCRRIFKGLITSYRLSKYPHRLQSFRKWIVLETIMHVNSEEFKEILSVVEEVKMEEKELADLLKIFTNFLSSFVSDGVFEPSLCPILAEYLQNYQFEEKCRRIFTNFCLFLTKLSIESSVWEPSTGNSILKFLKVETFLYWFNLEKLGLFILQKGHLFSNEQVEEIILFASESNKRTINTYERLLELSCKALTRHFPEHKIQKRNVVPMAIANSTSDSGQISFRRFIQLWFVMDSEGQKALRENIDASLDKQFDGELYNILLREKIYHYNYGNYFERFARYINQAKGKGMTGIKDGIPEYDDGMFENFAWLVYMLDIPFTDKRLKVFKKLSSFQKWLINPLQFNYKNFKPEWILATRNEFFLRRLTKVESVKEPLRKYAAEHRNEKLYRIYFEYFA